MITIAFYQTAILCIAAFVLLAFVTNVISERVAYNSPQQRAAARLANSFGWAFLGALVVGVVGALFGLISSIN